MATGPLPTLADLKRRLGIAGGNADEQLAHELAVATSWVVDRVYPPETPDEYPLEVGEAVLVAASRWYARRNTPEGVGSWGELGVVRVLDHDPDIAALLERHVDYTRVGIA